MKQPKTYHVADDLGYERDYRYRPGGRTKPTLPDWVEREAADPTFERWVEAWDRGRS